MKDHPKQNVAASVRQRLLNLSREWKEDFGLILSRYGSERLLYRLGISRWHDQFVLKGALLVRQWSDIPHRPTRDIDLLGYGSSAPEYISDIFRAICAIPYADDGLAFQADSVSTALITENASYQGVRVTLIGLLDSARIHIQVDIGYGDPVTPRSEEIILSSLLDLPAPRLRAYSVYSVIAEKYHAIVALGMSNSRMKDYFDLYHVARRQTLQRHLFDAALTATFERRRTELPASLPVGLTSEFASDPYKRTQWYAFLHKNKLDFIDLVDIVELLVSLFQPFQESDTPTAKEITWHDGGPWRAIHA